MARAFPGSRKIYDYSGPEPEVPPEVACAREIREVKTDWAGSRSPIDIREECDRIRRRYGFEPRDEY